MGDLTQPLLSLSLSQEGRQEEISSSISSSFSKRSLEFLDTSQEEINKRKERKVEKFLKKHRDAIAKEILLAEMNEALLRLRSGDLIYLHKFQISESTNKEVKEDKKSETKKEIDTQAKEKKELAKVVIEKHYSRVWCLSQIKFIANGFNEDDTPVFSVQFHDGEERESLGPYRSFEPTSVVFIPVIQDQETTKKLIQSLYGDELPVIFQ